MIGRHPSRGRRLPVEQFCPHEYPALTSKRSGLVALVQLTGIGCAGVNVAPSAGAVISGASGTLPNPWIANGSEPTLDEETAADRHRTRQRGVIFRVCAEVAAVAFTADRRVGDRLSRH